MPDSMTLEGDGATLVVKTPDITTWIVEHVEYVAGDSPMRFQGRCNMRISGQKSPKHGRVEWLCIRADTFQEEQFLSALSLAMNGEGEIDIRTKTEDGEDYQMHFEWVQTTTTPAPDGTPNG